MSASFSQTAAYIWSLAEILRGDFKPSQYGRVVLPFTILRRLECVLAPTKAAVLAQVQELKTRKLTKKAQDRILLDAAKQAFFNRSPHELATLDPGNLPANLLSYIADFSKEAREIFEQIRFRDCITQLHAAGLLAKVVQRVATTDLHPDTISNRDMGLVFEELIRKFAESSNETAGEHFTPRDIVRLTTALVFGAPEQTQRTDGRPCTIYDPTAGTGGFLSSGLDYLSEHNPNASAQAFGQELNPESYAICKGDMLIKGQDLGQIKLGNTLSQDHLPDARFDYLLSNPPFGVDWKKIEAQIRREHQELGFSGRFGPGLPRVSDGSLLFLLHLIGKMREHDPQDPVSQGGRIGIVLSGSPLYTGSAGSGESEIRRYLLEQDLLETIIALPTDLFYNTSIATYLWILSNHKTPTRKGKVQLINATKLGRKLRKSLGAKRQELGPKDIARITQVYREFQALPSQRRDAGNTTKQLAANHQVETPALESKTFRTHEFGYRRITIQRPLRLAIQLSPERIATLRFPKGPLQAPGRRLYEAFEAHWQAPEAYGKLCADQAQKARVMLGAQFKKLKDKQLCALLSPELWLAQRALLSKAERIAQAIGSEASYDFNAFEQRLQATLEAQGIKLDNNEQKQLIEATTWICPHAQPVIHQVLPQSPPDPIYGIFEYRGQVVRFRPDPNLRDHEDLPLTPDTAQGTHVEQSNRHHFERIATQIPDAWIDPSKRDRRDEEMGVVGYEIPFNQHFFEYAPLRPLADIDAELSIVSKEIMHLLSELNA